MVFVHIRSKKAEFLERHSKGQLLNPTGNSTHQQEKDRECFYTLCPLFLASTDLIKDN
jgi:hypothetical protein